jgi:hypothetical protein
MMVSGDKVGEGLRCSAPNVMLRVFRGVLDPAGGIPVPAVKPPGREQVEAARSDEAGMIGCADTLKSLEVVSPA